MEPSALDITTATADLAVTAAATGTTATATGADSTATATGADSTATATGADSTATATGAATTDAVVATHTAGAPAAADTPDARLAADTPVTTDAGDAPARRTRLIELSLPLWYGLHLNLVEDRASAREVGSPARGALVFYDGVIRRYTCDPQTGQAIRIDDIAADALQATIVGQGWTTGNLEPATVRVELSQGIMRKVAHIPAGVRSLHMLEGDRMVTYRIPHPHLLWFASWSDGAVWDRLYAIDARTGPPAGRALSPDDQLYVPPLFNVGLRSGVVCWGTVSTPPARKPTLHASPENVSVAERFDLFMSSTFKPQFRTGRCTRHPDDLLATWKLLHRAGASRYPERLLRPTCAYGDALRSEPRGSLGVMGDWL